MQLKDIEVNTSWEKIDQDNFGITLTEGSKYLLQVKSDSPVLFCNSEEEPTNNEGLVLGYGDQVLYKAKNNLYVKTTLSTGCVNIQSVEE